MQPQIDPDHQQRLREARKLAEILQALNTMPFPLIGRWHGGAFGGRIGMACIGDVVITARST